MPHRGIDHIDLDQVKNEKGDNIFRICDIGMRNYIMGIFYSIGFVHRND